MTQKSADEPHPKQRPGSALHPDLELPGERGLSPEEMAAFLNVSESWLAKARMRGDGPPYAKIGRMVRYFLSQASPWLKSRRRHSTSE